MKRNSKQKPTAGKPALKRPTRELKPADDLPRKKASLVGTAYEQIKESIITLHFLPGQYLNEGSICALLQVGRTPVHQALQRLELEGLVEIMPRKGVIVLPDSISEIIKILNPVRQSKPIWRATLPDMLPRGMRGSYRLLRMRSS